RTARAARNDRRTRTPGKMGPAAGRTAHFEDARPRSERRNHRFHDLRRLPQSHRGIRPHGLRTDGEQPMTHAGRQSERGFVLVIVLWVLAILTVISVGFGRRSVLDRRAAAFTLDKTQAMMLARGAVE